jgi:hypothetical protein
MNELLPISGGCALGVLLAMARRSMLWRTVLVLVLGACATIASGEFRLGTYYFAADIAEVALCAAVSYGIARAVVRHQG